MVIRRLPLLSMIAVLTLTMLFISCMSTGLLPRTNTGEHAFGKNVDTDNATRRGYVSINNPYEGSLWTPYNSRAFLFGDNKAITVNDIVTVKIMESSDASRNATTKLSRKNSMKSGITKFFGSKDLSFGMDNLWGKNTDATTAADRTKTPFQPELESATENSFNGDGSTARKDRFIATISARVCEVYPNGNMLIRGNREITINNERQFITLSGIIRPEDISYDNVVISTAIADAKISITGKGIISDKQSPGFGHRVFDWIWPF
ncbi:MAG: flagellar basal body L-ring protein FlgH [Desulfobacterota bacterium]|nr:flagellar basal body L-ring protein FlgH [Thermodesulfobacteriota bacterium]